METIWLSTVGRNRVDIPPALAAFLRYVAKPEEAPIHGEDPFVEGLQRKIAAIKKDRGWEARFMLLKEMLADEREEGKVEGRAESILFLLSTLGEIPDDLRGRILAEKDEKILNSWLLAAKKACSIQEFASQVR